jgi:UrcA family protein
MIRSFLISAIVPIALFSTVAPSLAQEETASVTVSYADLNLQTPAGAASLERRVHQAVYEVCGSEDDRDLSDWFAQRKCRADALKDARAKMNQAVAAARGQVQFAAVAPSLSVGR